MAIGLLHGFGCGQKLLADVLPAFAYRDVRLEFTQADRKPIASGSIYGFCRELNLIWPRRDHEMQGRNDVLWDDSFLGKTDSDGFAKAALPSGHWSFFALGHAGGLESSVVAGWAEIEVRDAGQTIHLLPTQTKHWILSCTNVSLALNPKRIFLKPAGFPIWIPANVATTNGLLSVSVPPSPFQMWAEGNPADAAPGFAMCWETLSNQTPDGKILPVGGAASVECSKSKGAASLSWVCRQNFGLAGNLNFTNAAKVLLTPAKFSLSYRRPVTANLMGDFVGQLYDFRVGAALVLNMDTPLTAGLDQALSKPSKSGEYKLAAQLFVVDGNGHLLRQLLNSRHEPVNPDATLILNGGQFQAQPVQRSVEIPDADEEGEDETATEESGQMLFTANLGTIRSVAGAVWDFNGPPGVFTHMRLTGDQLITEASSTFRMALPTVMTRDARNVLAQTEMLATVMDRVSGRRRKIEPTAITINPTMKGAAAAHNGSALSIGTVLLFSDNPMSGHTIVHELGHDYGFHHGGLHETVVEVSRCAGGDQITQQPAKWMFLDRMNGVPTPEARPLYPNKGLYLYCYAQGALKFLHFMSAYEHTVLRDLGKQGYSSDEITTTLLGLALGKDMTSICRNYGLNVTPDRVAQATLAIRLGR